jgi:polar amino acid transport system substrate-binding protein
MRFNKNVWFMLIIVGLILMLTGIAFAGDVSVMEKIKEREKLIIGTDPGYFPFEMVDNEGNIVGFDVDIAEAIATELGVELEVSVMQFRNLISALNMEKIDMIIAGMTITPGRALEATFSDSYFDCGLAMLVNEKHKGIKSWSELDKKGVVIAVSIGQTADFYSTKFFKNAEVRRIEGSQNCALAVSNGQVDAAVHDSPWVLVYAKKNPDHVFPLLEEHGLQSLGFAIPLNDYAFKIWLDSFLIHFKQSAEYEDLYDYWFISMPWLDE